MINKIKSEVKYEGKRFNVLEDTYANENGLEYIRDVVDAPAAALILAFTEDNEVVFVKQFREVINSYTLELPAGIIETGEEPKQAALREFEEETGYKAGSMEHLITIYPSCGYTNEQIHIFVAKDLTQGTQKLDSDESIEEVTLLPYEKCIKKAKKGYFVQASQNVALLLYHLRKTEGEED